MPRNALLDETKTDHWPVGAPGWCDKVRIQPTVAAILDRLRPATKGKGDQLIHGALKEALIARIVADDFRSVYDTVGEILGLDAPSGKPLPAREVADRRPPLTKIAR